MKISPHVNIYKFPITAITSIMNRITGVFFTGMYVSGGLCHLYGYSPLNIYDSLERLPKTAINVSMYFPVVYHTFGGIRHFVWDKFPHLLTNQKTNKSSYMLIGTSIASTYILEYIDILTILRT